MAALSGLTLPQLLGSRYALTDYRAGLVPSCEVQLSYAIGVAEPISVRVQTDGEAKVSDEKLSELVREIFPLKPGEIIEHLALRRPIFERTASGGHFGRNEPEFTWEKTDKVDELRRAARL